jgi:uncharacterized protein (TIGR02145 family)
MKKATITLLLICGAVFAQQKGSFTDTRDKKTYKTVKIGEQVWMAENLSYNAKGSKCYGEGGGVMSGEEDEEGNRMTKKLSNAEVQANCKSYGRLYDWNTAMKVCPSGWHLPSKEEWQKLVDFAGGKAEEKYQNNLMAKGWNIAWFKGTDSYGFSALPGGYDSGSGFEFVGSLGRWWSASEYDSNGNGENDRASSHLMGYAYESARGDDEDKSCLYSVRCIQD